MVQLATRMNGKERDRLVRLAPYPKRRLRLRTDVAALYGMVLLNTGLFFVTSSPWARACFVVSAVVSLVRIHRLRRQV